MKKRGVGICSNCLTEFKYSELFRVHILSNFGIPYIAPYCKKCAKLKYPNFIEFKVKESVALPRVKNKN